MQSEQQRSGRRSETPATPVWEKIVGLVGFFVLCTGFAYLARAAVTENHAPPQFQFNVEEIKELGSGYLVKVEVANSGYESVAALQMEGRLEGSAQEPETNAIQVDYVPSQSSRKVGFFFQDNPENGKLSFRALGYQEP